MQARGGMEGGEWKVPPTNGRCHPREKSRALVITDTEGFRRLFWLALWGGLICQIKCGETCFASWRHGLAGLSCSLPTKVDGEWSLYGFTDLDSVDRSEVGKVEKCKKWVAPLGFPESQANRYNTSRVCFADPANRFSNNNGVLS